MGANEPRVDISFVIVNWNTREYLLSCLESIYATVLGIPFEIWLVDNASSDGSVEAVKERFPGTNIIRNDVNRGFAAANNQAFAHMRGRYALLLNSDAALQDGAAKALYDFMEGHPDAGMVCGQLLNPDGSRQNSIANYPTLLTLASNETVLRLLLPRKYPSRHNTYPCPIKVDSCIGACLMVRSEALRRVGGLDERYFFFFEETDWALGMKRAGWNSYFVPQARIVHAQGKSVGQNAGARKHFYRSRYLYFRKWHPRSFPLYYGVIFTRLLVNTLLASVGTLLTLALHRSLRRRLAIYLNLILWHFKGCPAD